MMGRTGEVGDDPRLPRPAEPEPSVVEWLDWTAENYRTRADALAAEPQGEDLRRRAAELQQALVWYRMADLIGEHAVVVRTNHPDRLLANFAARCAGQLTMLAGRIETVDVGFQQELGMYYRNLFGVLGRGDRG